MINKLAIVNLPEPAQDKRNKKDKLPDKRLSVIEKLVANEYIKKNNDINRKIVLILGESTETRLDVVAGASKVPVYLIYAKGNIRAIEKKHIEVL